MFKLKIYTNKQTNSPKTITCKSDQTILDALMQQSFVTQAICAGNGTCGKCKIRVTEGTIPITESDKRLLSRNETADGLRLACQAYPNTDLSIELYMEQDTNHDILTSYLSENKNNPEQTDSTEEPLRPNDHNNNNIYGIAADIGTTTIVLQLLRIPPSAPAKPASAAEYSKGTHTIMNPQRIYGADVISRIQSAISGNEEHMRQLIWDGINNGITQLIQTANIDPNKVKEAVFSGNTTMNHIIMDYPCDTLGTAPYTPYNITTIKTSLNLPVISQTYPLTLFPGISTFVGGDIVSGLLFCEFDKLEGINLLIDLGTNGEMAIGTKTSILTTSTAAGPAFEGGNLSSGVGSVPGAICSINLDNGFSYKTIGNAPAIGFCGTGALELTAELLLHQHMDNTGLLSEEWFEKGFAIPSGPNSFTLTQKDIRELQLAKAAIRAGIETLLLRYGCQYEDINTVYLAGGFGFHLNIEKAAAIGLIPNELTHKVTAIGNSSLGGAAYSMLIPNAMKRAEYLVSISKEISLATDTEFYDMYVEHMMF